MTTTTRPAASCALGANAGTADMTGARSERALPPRKIAENEAELLADKEPNLAEPTRVEALSDGAFAIIITLLVLEIHRPSAAPGNLDVTR